jgi:ATP-dependent DNA helicase DinG
MSKPSPFNYRDNALLYINKNAPYPSQQSERYIAAITDETERLINAANGHTVVLFTSYSVMNLVYANLEKRGLSFPMMKLERSTSNAIEQFKKSGNGVLFASGTLWEGIDIPGDALSMLIIVKLPFQAPDAIGEYERSQYGDSRAYLDEVLVPDMLIKLKQGFGRLIRTETDTGVVAILDYRANENGAYFERVLNALPDCHITSDISDVDPFLREGKSADFYE